jgi:hypothetical protein
MPYYRFFKDDIFYNQIETNPRSVFLIYSASIFYNNMPARRGTDGPAAEDAQRFDIPNVPSGYISLYEMNVDRDKVLHTWDYALSPGENEAAGNKKAMIHPFVTKAGGLHTFKTMTTGTFNTLHYGDMLTASFKYPLSASIQREYYSENQNRFSDQQKKISDLKNVPVKYSHLDSLRNVFNHYVYLSHHYAYDYGDENIFGVGNDRLGIDKSIQELNLISIPSIFYGSSIKKGSVDLKFYVSGTLIGQCMDKYKNGELIEVTGSQTGSVAGVVLYKEGFIALTGSWDLTNRTATNTTDPKVPSLPGTNKPAYPRSPHTEKYRPKKKSATTDPAAVAPKWTYFGTGIERSGSLYDAGGNVQTGYGIFATGSLQQFHLPSSSFSLEFEGVNYVPTITMLAHAPTAELNHSNNPTYIESNAKKPLAYATATLMASAGGGGGALDDLTLILTNSDGSTHTITCTEGPTSATNVDLLLTTAGIDPAESFAAELKRVLDLAFAPGSIDMAVSDITNDSDGHDRVINLRMLTAGTAGNKAIAGTLVSGDKLIVNNTEHGGAHGTQAFTGGSAGYVSNNKYSGSSWPITVASQSYVQYDKMAIKNIVSSSYANHTASFKKQTYISKIGVYDENKNLIAIAKLATPVKKTEERDLTFKLKLDI